MVDYWRSRRGSTPPRHLDNVREAPTQPASLHLRLTDAGIRPDAARALQALGMMPRSDFKTFLGLEERLVIDQLKRLIRHGLVESPTPKPRQVYSGLPVWFAQGLFPDLHRRFS